jgi:hypothetical protein
MAATTGNVLTAAQFNQYWRDNLLVSEAAVATNAGNLLVADGAHSIVERIPTVGFTSGTDTTTSTTFTTLFNDTSVVATTGANVLVSIGGAIDNDTAHFGGRIGLDISGATTRSASDAVSYYSDISNPGYVAQGTWTTIVSLTAGLNLFDLRYRAVFGGTAAFSHRLVAVVPF